jgi:hypothetical protein
MYICIVPFKLSYEKAFRKVIVDVILIAMLNDRSFLWEDQK